MTDLENKLHQILQEKQDKIKPENIKKGIQIFDIEGTYEGDISSTKIKLFETQEEMQQDPNVNEGDLAVVYRDEIQNMTADSQTQFLTFPETVTLPQALTESYYCRLRATDPSKMFDGNVMLNQNSFRFDGFGDSGMIQVQYTSSDGITYTREEFTGDNGELTNPVDLGTPIHCEMVEEWNDNFGYFMQIGGNVFEGLYKYDKNNLDKTKLNLVNASSVSVNYNEGSPVYNWDGNYNTLIIDRIKLEQVLEKIKSDLGINSIEICIKDDNLYFYTFDKEYTYIKALYYNTNNEYLGLTVAGNGGVIGQDCPNLMIYSIDLDNISYSLFEQIAPKYLRNTEQNVERYYVYFDWKPDTFPKSLHFYNMDNINYNYALNVQIYYEKTSNRFSYKFLNNIEAVIYKLDPRYINAPSQLTTINDKVYNSIYYGKDEVNEGTLTQNVSNSFADINAEVYSKIQQVYNNMEPKVLTDDDKTIDKNIYFIPTKLDGTPLLDTSQVTDISSMFDGCTNLITIPLLDTSQVTNMRAMFYVCTSLVTIPLLDTSKVTNMERMFNDCTNLTTIPLLNTSKVTSMFFMFNDCTNLTTIPLLDTSSITSMNSMFSGCTNLSEDSLNNILAMCINATKVATSNKTLKSIGLSEEQATKCTTLSNYTAFTEASWTTGY